MTEEHFDIVDNEDRIVGLATRSEVHGNPDLIHRVAHVLVFNSQGELFLQKRALSKDIQPGKWDTSVGGHVDQGESYYRAALREMREELEIEPEKVEFLYKYLHSNEVETEYVSTYRCVWNGIISTNPQEIIEGRFWSLDDIAQASDSGVFTPNFLDELSRYQEYCK